MRCQGGAFTPKSTCKGGLGMSTQSQYPRLLYYGLSLTSPRPQTIVPMNPLCIQRMAKVVYLIKKTSRQKSIDLGKVVVGDDFS